MKNRTKIISKLKVVAESVEPVSRAQLAAAIVYKNKVIAIGTNQLKTHPIMIEFQRGPGAIFLHAEIDAINKARRKISDEKLSKSTLIVVRVRKDGSFGMAKPCRGCADCIDHFRINNVYYTLTEE